MRLRNNFVPFYLGDTGPGLLSWVADVLGQNLAFENIRVIYPTAPSR